MLNFKIGNIVRLPETNDLPAQRATVIAIEDGGPNSDLLTVRIFLEDRVGSDRDGLTEVDETVVQRIKCDVCEDADATTQTPTELDVCASCLRIWKNARKAGAMD